MKKYLSTSLLLAGILHAAIPFLQAEDWPQWGRNASKNMVSGEKGMPLEFSGGDTLPDSEEIDVKTAKNAKWVVKLGSQAYGTPTISQGRIFVGTNNESPRNPLHEGDRGIVMSLDEKTGAFQWQLVCQKLGAGKVSDWEYLGICSSATADEDRVYVITNRCEILCMDIKGMADGNNGPYKDEAKYVSPKGGEAIKLGEKDADILWIYDMRGELGIFPHNIASSSILVSGDKIIATTSNGVDWSHTNIPAPQAPTLIMLDKKTGKLLGEEASGVSKRVMHCNWSSPAMGKIDGKAAVLFGAGDGFCYAFGTETKKDKDGYEILPEIWRYDANLPEYRKDKEGKPIKYAEPEGPSEIISTPVFYDNHVYVAIGQDPEHGEGVGLLSCLDEKGKAVWTYKGVDRTISTPSIADGILYLADYTGRVHCLDAKTGEKYWVYDTKSHIWGSTLVADGKVYVGNEDGEVTVLKAGKKLEKLALAEFPAPVYSTPVAANGVLYITTQTHLYAFVQPKP